MAVADGGICGFRFAYLSDIEYLWGDENVGSRACGLFADSSGAVVRRASFAAMAAMRAVAELALYGA